MYLTWLYVSSSLGSIVHKADVSDSILTVSGCVCISSSSTGIASVELSSGRGCIWSSSSGLVSVELSSFKNSDGILPATREKYRFQADFFIISSILKWFIQTLINGPITIGPSFPGQIAWIHASRKAESRANLKKY